ncbi:unnamed protein product [Prorocentrum cordatum]|uniref:Uncharacterized protein n=1 Tax=Prorocentrum cordatum TaxID=2364126 RepID=A0ABN9U5C4_9DINO|nr:unnamed protein product [Polarella glacialis]
MGVVAETAIVTGVKHLDEQIPYGCPSATVDVPHDAEKGEVANLARSLYYTRQTAEELAQTPNTPPKVAKFAGDVARYANDLEFFTRQLALGLRMPVTVEPPYLPVDLQAVSPAAVLAAAFVGPRAPAPRGFSRRSRRPLRARAARGAPAWRFL